VAVYSLHVREVGIFGEGHRPGVPVVVAKALGEVGVTCRIAAESAPAAFD
jgi:hypothetical protein